MTLSSKSKILTGSIISWFFTAGMTFTMSSFLLSCSTLILRKLQKKDVFAFYRDLGVPGAGVQQV